MTLLILLLLPPLAGFLLCLLRKSYHATLLVTLLASAANLVVAVQAYRNNFSVTLPISVHGFDFTFHADAVSSLFLLLAAAAFLLAALYAAGYARGKDFGGLQLMYLFLSLGMLNGALLSDHLGLMLFFWEGLLCTQFGALVHSNVKKPRAAVKALTLSGTSDLILMLGIASASHAAETGTISAIEKMSVTGLGAVGCVLILLGAFGKAGCIPFQTWIPVAAEDAQTPFMAAYSGTMGPIAGIYLGYRAVTQMFDLSGSSIAFIFAIIGALTMIGGAIMSLSQYNYKRAISWIIISQTGYTAMSLCMGLEGGMILPLLTNSVFCGTGMLMLAGTVEETANTSDLHKLGGLSKYMPMATFCSILFSLSISVFPIFSGLFAGASFSVLPQRLYIVFCIGVIPGIFLTVLSLLRLTRGVFFGSPMAVDAEKQVPRAGIILPILPAALISLVCVFESSYATSFIRTALGGAVAPVRTTVLVLVFFGVLALAVFDHFYGCRKDEGARNACAHVYAIPGVRQFCALKECGVLDPYAWLNAFMAVLSRLCRKIEDGVSWIYDRGIPSVVYGIGDGFSRFNNGSLSRYLFLAVCGMFAVALIFLIVLL